MPADQDRGDGRTGPPEVPYPARAQGAWMVGVLTLVTFIGLLDRSVPNMLAEPIRRDLAISDSQFSLILGYAYAIPYCVAGLPFGRLVDDRNRRNLIMAGVPLWSAMTILCGFANSFVEILLARIGLGVSLALLAPAAYSIVADYFEPRVRGRALAAYSLSMTIGASLSFFLAGAILSAFAGSKSVQVPMLGAFAPWQMVFLVAGAAGLATMPLLFSVREPPRRGLSRGAQGTLREFLGWLRADGRTFGLIYATYGLLAFIGFCVVPWAPAFYMRRFGLPAATIGFWLGLVLLAGGVVGTLTGGMLSDRWAAQGRRPGGRFLVPLASMIVNIPVMLALPLVGDAATSLALVGVATMISSLGLTSGPVTLQAIVPNQMRGKALALYQIVIILVSGFAPTAVALVTDHVFHDDRALPYSLAVVPCVASLIGVLAAASGYRSYARKMKMQGVEH